MFRFRFRLFKFRSILTHGVVSAAANLAKYITGLQLPGLRLEARAKGVRDGARVCTGRGGGSLRQGAAAARPGAATSDHQPALPSPGQMA